MAVSRRSIVVGVTITAISLAIVVAASGGTGGTEASAPARVDPAQPSDCFARLPSDPGAATALGRVHFYGYGKGWHQGDELQIDANPGWKSANAKQAIAIRRHDLVTLQVPAKARRSVDLVGWGTNNVAKADIIRIRLNADSPCADHWAAYPGGFRFTRKQCFRLNVKADGRTTTVPFGFGKSCN